MAMENISIGLSKYLMVDILISHIRVINTRIRYATYIEKHHHGISADVMVSKSGIILDK